MEQKSHNNDWLISFMAAVAIVATVIGNYYFHGGHIVW